MVAEKRWNLRFAQAEFPLSYPAEYEKSHYDLIQPPGSILCYLAWPKLTGQNEAQSHARHTKNMLENTFLACLKLENREKDKTKSAGQAYIPK